MDPAEVTVGESAAATCTLMGGGVFEADQTVKVVDGDGTVLQTATLPAGERTVTVALDTATAGAFEIGGRIDLPSALGGGNLTSGIVAFTVLDPAAKRVLVSTDELEIAEGFSGTYTVVLSRAPTADVTVAVAQTVATYLNGNLIVGPNPIAGIDFEPATLTFTAQNWDTPQTVTVSGLQDANDEPASALFTHTPSGGGYDGAETGDVFVLVNDDENPATPLTPSVLVNPAELTIDEGGSGTYTVVLGHAPTADVTVAVAQTVAVRIGGILSLGTGPNPDIAFEPASLTFTAQNWDTPQTVTVSARQDADALHTAALFTHTPSGGGYDAALAADVYVVVHDDESFPTRVTLAVTPASVSEGAEPTTFTVTGTLNGLYLHRDVDVTVSVASAPGSGPADFQPVDDFTFTIQAGDRFWFKQFTLTLVDDALDEPDETVVLTGTAVSSTGGTLPVTGTALTIADDDTLGLVIAPATLALTEGGVAAAYTLRLATQPTADVTVTPVSSGADLEFTPAELTFTPASWETPQSMAVTAVDDGDVLPGTASVSHTTAGGNYAGGSFPDAVAVTIDDDDMPGVTVSPQALVIGEGKSDAYTVVLRTEPPGDVTITPAVPAGTDVIVRPQRLVFAPGNWEVAQSFTVEALADDDAAPEAAVTVAHAATGGGYDTVAVAPVTVEVAEDDAVGVVVAPLTIEVPEGGPGKTYTVVLTSAPTAPVTVTPTGLARADAKVTVTPASVTFDATHWSTPKPFMVEAADDADSDDALERIPHDVAGGDYQGAAADTVTATVKDDEVASAEVALSVDPARVDEGTGLGGGVSVTVTATLDRAPRASPTEVTVSVGAGTGASAAQASDFEAVADFTLTIPADTLSGTQTFTLATTSDDVDEGDETLAVTGMTTVPGLAVTGAVLTIVELSTRGIFASADAVTVAEGDTVGATYGVSLETEPTGTVTVRAVPEAGTDVRVAPATLAFTAGDWEEPQYFAVTAVDDADSATDVVATVTHRASGGGYDGLAGEAPVAVTIVETDVPGVRVTRPTAPELFEGESYTYTVVLQTRPAGDVTVTPQVPAGAEITITPALAVFEPDEWDRPRTFTIRVAEDDDGIHDGRVAIGHGVTGPGAYATVTVSPLLVTLSDDDLALVAVSPGSSGLEVTENGAGAFLVMLGSQPTATVTVSASESSAAIAIPNATLTFTRSSWNVAQALTVSALDDSDSDDEEATVTFTAAGGDYANAALQTRTVTVKDDDVASTAVRLSVAPSTVDEDDGSVTITVTGTLNGMTRSGATDIALSVAGVTATAGDDYTFGYSGDFRIRISGGQMSGTKTFTLSPVDDDLYEEAEYLNVTGSHGTLDVTADDLLIDDNDTRGIVLSATAVTVTEDDAAGATYTVALTSEPAEGSVTVTPVPDAWTDVLVAPATLTFTADDWDTPKTVTVTGGPDEDGRTDPVAGISHTVAGGEYRGLTVTGRVAVTIVEDDAPGLTVSVQAVEVAEGATATWTVGLATRPSAPVTVTPVLPGGAEAEVRPATLTFTADGSWDREQTVTLTALEDDDAVADAAFTVGHTAAGGGYGGVSAPGIAVTVTEDDAAALTVAPATLAVAEGDAAGAAIMVSLASAPTAPVTVAAALENAGVGKMTVEPATRSFTTGNWSVPQSFTVKGLADADGDDVVADVLFTASGGDYAGAAGRAAVTVEDDDKASTEVRLTVAPSGVAEDAGPSGAAVTVTAALDAAPRNAGTLVTVRVGPGTGAGAAGTGDFEAVTAFTFTIPAGATQASAEFTLVPVDDDVFEGDETLRLSGTVNAAGLTVVGTALVIGEDDVRGIALSTTALTVVEAGAGVRYAVALATRPSGAVTVHADAPASTDLRVTPASLEFTALDWNVAQQFTVSAVDDADMTADAVAAIAHRVTGADYAGVTVSDTVAVTIAENDAPTVAVTPTALAVDEGGSGSYTVVLAAQPTRSVRVTAKVPAGHGDVTVKPAERMFTPQDWYVAQSFTVAHRGDADAVDDPAVTITHAIEDPARAVDYDTVAVDPVTVSFRDLDTAGLVFVPAAVTMPEASVATYTVALATQPTASVTVTPSVPAGTDVTVLTGALAFTTQSWNVPQTVTVIAGPDSDPDDDRVTVDHLVAGGDYGTWAETIAGVAGRVLPVTVEDDDMPSTEVRLTLVPARVAEDGGGTLVTVTGELDGAPLMADTEVRITVLAGAGTDGAEAADFEAVTAFTLTIGAGRREATAQFTFTPVDDDVAEGDERAVVDGAVAGLTVVPAALAIGDDDRRGIVLLAPAVTVTEGDSAGTGYTVRLASEPTGTVTVFADAPAGTDVRVAPASLEFTALSWNVAQSFTVTAVHDDDGIDETGLAIAHRVAGADYQGLAVADTVAVTIDDDDIPRIVVDPPSVEFTEGVKVDNAYTVKLATEPTGTVTVTLGVPAELEAAPATLTFTGTDWSAAQPVTVTPREDDDARPRPPLTSDYAIGHSASGGGYDAAPGDTFTARVLENDTPGVTVSKTTLTVHEEDTAGGDYTVVLDSEPGADVTVTVAGHAGTDARIDRSSLTFTPSDWNTPQTVTVTAVDDADSDNDEVALTHAAASADADYQGIAIAGVAVTVDDNDDPSTQVTLAVAPEGVAEDAAATAVTVTGMLDGAPRADETVVYVTVSAGTAGAGEFTPVTAFALSIAAGLRTGTAQFEFAPVDDKVDEGTETVVVDGFTLAPGLAVVPVNLSILDDDTRGLVISTPAVTVTEGGTTVDEDPVTGGAAAYTVVLASQPTGPVTVHADAPAGTIVRVASSGAPALTASLHFTTANWQTAQTVTVTAVHDEDGMDIELSAGLAIAHRVTGADYQGLAVDDTVAVKVIDDDKPRIVVMDDPPSATVDGGRGRRPTW